MFLPMRAMLFASILLMASSFPASSWKSISFSLTNQLIDSTVIDFDGSNVFVYVFILSTDALSLKLHYYNASTYPPTQLAFNAYTFPNPISKPNIIPLNTKALLSYDVSSTSTSYLVQLAKSNLAVETNWTTAKRQKGVYIREYDYLISQRQSERVIAQPEVGGGTVKATYSLGSTPETNMFIYTNSLTKLFTVYNDVKYLLIRNLNSDVNTFASVYNSPVFLSMAVTGYSCACFNADQTMLYIYDSELYLVGYDLAAGKTTVDLNAGVTGVINCYFDSNANSVVLVKNNYEMKEFNISSLTTTTHATTYESFSIERTGTYAAMHQGNTLDIFMVNSPSCSNGFFFDATTNTCQACPAACLLCSSSTLCSSCLPGYILSANLCVSCPSNCDTCSSPSVCITCTSNYILNGGNLCDPICPANCLTCATPAKCSSCASTFFLNLGTKLCDQCPNNCDTCSSSTVCSICSSNYILNASSLCNLNSVPSSNSSQITFFQELIVDLLENGGLGFANKIPGGRRALPFLCFLVNIDELWLYQYHQRSYGETMNSIFESIQKLQNQKWKLLQDQTTEVIYQKLRTTKEKVYQFIDTKFNYTGAKFKEKEGRGETFLPACYEFLTFNLLFILVAFLILHWGHRLLKNCSISKHLRPFSMGLYLTPLLLDGNLQYFCFLLFSQISLGFSLNPRDKFLNVLNYLFYFVIIFVSVVSCFMAYWLSRRLAKYLLDNWKTKLYGLLAYSLTNAVRMLVLGALHSLLRSHPAQLPLLLSVQVIYIVFLVFCMGYWRAHRVSFKIWFTVLFSMLRIGMQAIMIVQQNIHNSQSEVELKLEVIFGFILTIYFFSIYVATLWEVFYQIIELLKPAFQSEGYQKQGPEKQNENQKKKEKEKKSEKSKKKSKENSKKKSKEESKESSKKKDIGKKTKAKPEKSQKSQKKQKSKSKSQSCVKKKEQKKESKSKKQQKKSAKKQESSSLPKNKKEKERQVAPVVIFNQQIAEDLCTPKKEAHKTPKKKKYVWTIRQVKQ